MLLRLFAPIHKLLLRNIRKESLYIAAGGLGGILNLGMSIFLGRILNFEEFALINFINGILICITTISGAFGTVVNYKTGYLIGKSNDATAYHFWKKIRLNSFLFTFLITLIWLFLTPLITSYFHIGNFLPVLLCAFIFIVSFGYSADRGLLSSRLKFIRLSILSIFEPLFKLLGAFILVFIGFHYWTFTIIPIAFFCSFLLGWYFIEKNPTKLPLLPKGSLSFPKVLFSAILFSSFSQIILLSFDVILAKHFLSTTDAGRYGLISVITKIIFFVGSLISPLIAPFVSRYEGRNQDTSYILKKVFLGTVFLILPFFILFGFLSSLTAPFLFGSKATTIIQYLPITTFAISCFVLGKIVSDYYILKKYYIFPLVFFAVGFFQLLYISFSNVTLGSFTYIVSGGWITAAIIVFILHAGIYYKNILKNNTLLIKK